MIEIPCFMGARLEHPLETSDALSCL
jgi:hypothetical protein